MLFEMPAIKVSSKEALKKSDYPQTHSNSKDSESKKSRSMRLA